MNDIDPIYAELAGRLGLEDSIFMPQILQRLMSFEQAQIVQELPAPPEEIGTKLNLDKAAVEAHLQELFEKGVVFPTRKGYQMARTFSQMHDTQTNPKFDETLGVEYFELWHKLIFEEQGGPIDILLEELAGGELPATRIIPRWRSIENTEGVLPCEDVREILKAQDQLALIPCVCQRLHPHRECDVPNEKCIVVGRTALYHLKRGDGRTLNVEEALRRIEELDNHPVVHITLNQKGVNLLLCNCHACCCDVIKPMTEQTKYALTQGLAKSRYLAVVDPDDCRGCGKCLESCPFGAVQTKTQPDHDRPKAFVDPEKCMGCGVCVLRCHAEARAMKLVRPADHIPETIAGIYG
jgi:NAD-dependent dihydropyrimidine dehydrogenase PreA subunit/biotin operon repressor